MAARATVATAEVIMLRRTGNWMRKKRVIEIAGFYQGSSAVLPCLASTLDGRKGDERNGGVAGGCAGDRSTVSGGQIQAAGKGGAAQARGRDCGARRAAGESETRGGGTGPRATRYAVSRRRMDGAAVGASHRGQPHERISAGEAGAHRGLADDHAVRREGVGDAARFWGAGKLVGHAAREPARQVGDAAGVADRRAMGARHEASRKWTDDRGDRDPTLWLALAAPRGAHCATAREERLVRGTPP